MIPDVALPASGTSMPILGFGTWRLSGPPCYDAVRIALDTGYRHVDTAAMYHNEPHVGRAVRDSGIPREHIFVTTKLPPDRSGTPREILTTSLSALGLEYVDLWLIHWPPPGRDGSVRMWREFMAARDAGLAKAIGVSNYSLAQLDELARETGEMPAVNQIPWSTKEHDPSVLAGHRERGVVVQGYSVLKRSNLRDRVLREIATTHGVTVAQVVLRWHLAHDIVMIPKSATADRIAENFDLFGFTLTPDEIAGIDALS